MINMDIPFEIESLRRCDLYFTLFQIKIFQYLDMDERNLLWFDEVWIPILWKGIMDKFRIEIESIKLFLNEEDIKFTISVGVAGYKKGEEYNDTPKKLIILADSWPL